MSDRSRELRREGREDKVSGRGVGTAEPPRPAEPAAGKHGRRRKRFELLWGLRYFARRLALIPVTLFGLCTVSFFLVNLVPSNPAGVVLGDFATPEQVERVNKRLGLDGSIWSRYGEFLHRLGNGSLGKSYFSDESVVSGLGNRVASTLELVIGSWFVAFVLGTALGLAMAYWKSSARSNVINMGVALVQSIPDFVLGILGSLAFFYYLGVLPLPLGQLPPQAVPPPTVTGAAFVDSVLSLQGASALSALKQLILPVAALGVAGSVVFARIVNSASAEALNSGHTTFARARGLREFTVVWLAMRASILPAVAASGIVIGTLVGGDAIVEVVFNWQGMGQWGAKGALETDLPVLEGFIIAGAGLSLLAYIVADMSMYWLDPRVRVQN